MSNLQDPYSGRMLRDADGVANFRVGTHPAIVINVHPNSADHVVTLRAVSGPDNTTTNTTFHSTALLSAPNGAITLTSTTFAGAVTVPDTGAFTTTQTAFQAGATVKASQAMNIAVTFGEQGTYQFISTDGDIDLTLSSDLSLRK